MRALVVLLASLFLLALLAGCTTKPTTAGADAAAGAATDDGPDRTARGAHAKADDPDKSAATGPATPEIVTDVYTVDVVASAGAGGLAFITQWIDLDDAPKELTGGLVEAVLDGGNAVGAGLGMEAVNSGGYFTAAQHQADGSLRMPVGADEWDDDLSISVEGDPEGGAVLTGTVTIYATMAIGMPLPSDFTAIPA